jgi:CheY-like chemotaxis protein/two-component sensor histidine kinase
VEFAKTIHASGTDLLTLINDILDLSKIESGTVTPDISDVPFRDLRDYVERAFRYLAETKKLGFRLDIDNRLPKSMRTDVKRLQQVLKNLLSNAFKFTERGEVTLSIAVAESGWNPQNEQLNRAKSVVVFSVHDTGIGIPPEKQQIIFEAFQQADGSTSRKYGGTGLGLAISRELARLLGGEIRLESTTGIGSTFTLFLPVAYAARRTMSKQLTSEGAVSVPEPERTDIEVMAPPEEPTIDLMDDSSLVQAGDRVVLIVENDEGFARFLLEIAHENAFKALVATRGITALSMAAEYHPEAITLDINLPDLDGWRVLSRLKEDPRTRHIPVQIITTEEDRMRGLRMGAMGILTKPIKTKEPLDETFAKIKRQIEPRIKRVVVAMSDQSERTSLSDLLGGDDVEITTVGSAQDVMATLKERPVDVLVMGLKLADKDGFDLIDEVTEDPELAELPILVYTIGGLSKKEETHLKRLSQTMVLKDVRSPGRLIDEVALFLHRPLETMPSSKREMLEKLHETQAVLQGKSVLVVDDDIRNIFAMTSLLEPQGMQVFSAETGKTAIEILENQPDIDVVLMDIMMPDMDGHETIRAIRKLSKFRSLPILALTAKAMKGDREKCIEAGASDYISKPVDTTQLLSLLRVWLYR